MNKQKTPFKLIGLGREKSMTCEPLGNENMFWPRVDLHQKIFDALWDTIGLNWTGRERVIIEHEGLNDDGIPEKGRVIGYFIEQEEQK